MYKSVEEFAKDLAVCMEPISTECLCTDPPDPNNRDPEMRDYDDPECHSQYCPIYIYALIKKSTEPPHPADGRTVS